MKSQIHLLFLLSGNAHVYWILDPEGESALNMDLQECKGDVFREVGRDEQKILFGLEISLLFSRGLPSPYPPPKKLTRRGLMSTMTNTFGSHPCRHYVKIDPDALTSLLK